jgi:hypothetical protein
LFVLFSVYFSVSKALSAEDREIVQQHLPFDDTKKEKASSEMHCSAKKLCIKGDISKEETEDER